MKNLILFSIIIVLNIGCDKFDVTQNVTSTNRSVGVSARDLLTSNHFKSLKIEVQYMTGYEPDATALDQLTQFLNTYINKPEGISVVTKEIPAAGSTVLSVDDILAIENSHRTFSPANEQAVVYILYTNGSYTNEHTLGVAYRNTSAALFGKKIRDNSGGIGQVSRTKLESAVLQHELGHLLGLVDIGTPMVTPHKDVNGGHCSNDNCLMYYASETTEVLGFLLTGSVPPLDAACAADLKAFGGK